MNAISDMKPGDASRKTFPLPEEPIIRGIFQTGQFDYDLNFMLVSTEKAQELWGMADAVHGIAVRVKDLDQAVIVKDELNRTLPPDLRARTWMDDNQDLFNAVATERVVMAVILYLVMIVAAFGLCSTLITTTVQKSREIGLMKALGANDFQVCNVFLLNGLVIGILGSVSGTLGRTAHAPLPQSLPRFPSLHVSHPGLRRLRLRPAGNPGGDRSRPGHAHCAGRHRHLRPRRAFARHLGRDARPGPRRAL